MSDAAAIFGAFASGSVTVAVLFAIVGAWNKRQPMDMESIILMVGSACALYTCVVAL
ncbi:MAG: hypothetical protein ACPGVA_16775 [Pikeienuella sp.]